MQIISIGSLTKCKQQRKHKIKHKTYICIYKLHKYIKAFTSCTPYLHVTFAQQMAAANKYKSVTVNSMDQQ